MKLTKVIGLIVGLVAVVMAIVSFYSPILYPKKTVLVLWVITTLLTLTSAYHITRDDETEVDEITNPRYKDEAY